MEDGPELDALVAEHVMGYDMSKTFSDEYGKYSTYIGDAWEVVEKLEEYSPVIRKSDAGQWQCTLHHEEKLAVYGDLVETAPHSICLASLRAVGYQPPSETTKEALAEDLTNTKRHKTAEDLFKDLDIESE